MGNGTPKEVCKFLEIARKNRVGAYRFGFNGQEQDPDLAGGTGVVFKYRIHDPRIGKFLSVDPLAKEYPWNSTYAFAENVPIAGIDLEGRELFLNIYSPEISGKMQAAIDAGDVLEQRRLSYWALNNRFPDAWASKLTEDISGANFKAGSLDNFSNGKPIGMEGIYVTLYSHFDKDGNKLNPITDNLNNSVEIAASEYYYFRPLNSGNSPGDPIDEVYPVDMYLWTGNGEVADGVGHPNSDYEQDIYYKDYDVRGGVLGANAIKGKALMWARIKGYGYTEFSVNTSSLSLNLSLLKIKGKYIGPELGLGFPSDGSPSNLAGHGASESAGIGIGLGLSIDGGQWQSFGSGGVLWEGTSEGVNFGFGAMKLGLEYSNSKLMKEKKENQEATKTKMN